MRPIVRSMVWLLVVGCGRDPDATKPKSSSRTAVEAAPVEPSPKPSPKQADDVTHAPPGEAFHPPVVGIERTAQGVELDVVVRRATDEPPFVGPLKLTAEPFSLSITKVADRVTEADVFGSGLALDLDGNGSMADVFDVACDGGSGVLAGTRLVPVVAEDGRFHFAGPDGASRVVRLGARGAWAVLYGSCERDLNFGVSPADHPIEVLELEAPALQILVFEPVGGPDDASKLAVEDVTLSGDTVKGEVHQGHDYEPLTGAEPRWYAMSWWIAPLDPAAEEQVMGASLRAPADALDGAVVVAIINEATPGSDRIRGPVQMAEIR